MRMNLLPKSGAAQVSRVRKEASWFHWTLLFIVAVHGFSSVRAAKHGAVHLIVSCLVQLTRTVAVFSSVFHSNSNTSRWSILTTYITKSGYLLWLANQDVVLLRKLDMGNRMSFGLMFLSSFLDQNPAFQVLSGFPFAFNCLHGALLAVMRYKCKISEYGTAIVPHVFDTLACFLCTVILPRAAFKLGGRLTRSSMLKDCMATGQGTSTDSLATKRVTLSADYPACNDSCAHSQHSESWNTEHGARDQVLASTDTVSSDQTDTRNNSKAAAGVTTGPSRSAFLTADTVQISSPAMIDTCLVPRQRGSSTARGDMRAHGHSAPPSSVIEELEHGASVGSHTTAACPYASLSSEDMCLQRVATSQLSSAFKGSSIGDEVTLAGSFFGSDHGDDERFVDASLHTVSTQDAPMHTSPAPVTGSNRHVDASKRTSTTVRDARGGGNTGSPDVPVPSGGSAGASVSASGSKIQQQQLKHARVLLESDPVMARPHGGSSKPHDGGKKHLQALNTAPGSAPACRSALIAKLMTEHCRAAYKPLAGAVPQKVVLKAGGRVEPRHLTQEFAVGMRQALCDMGMSRYQVIDISVRAGCVVITMDLAAPHNHNRCLTSGGIHAASQTKAADLQEIEPDDVLSEEADAGVAGDADLHVFIHTLLSHLEPALKRSSKTGGIENGQSVSCQVDDQVIEATWRSSSDTWQLEIIAQASQAAHPTFGFAQQIGMPQEAGPGAAAAGSTTSSPSAAAAARHATDARYVPLCFEVQMFMPDKTYAKSTTFAGYDESDIIADDWNGYSATLSQSAAPGQEGVAPQPGQPAELSMLMRCQGGYVKTHVRLMGGPGLLRTVQVRADVPQHCLPRHHHEDAAPVGLLPLTLELVQGHTLLQTLPLLATLHDKHVPGSNASSVTAAQRDKFWWWCSSEACTAAAVKDLHKVGADLWHDVHAEEEDKIGSGITPAIASWHGFMHDLITWIQHVRQEAAGRGHCYTTSPSTCMLPATDLRSQPILTQPLADQIYTNLQQISAQLGMRNVSAWLKEQKRNMARSSPSTHAALNAALFGDVCEQCEASCKETMACQIAWLQPWGLGLVSLIQIAARIRCASDIVAVLEFMPFLASSVLGCFWAIYHRPTSQLARLHLTSATADERRQLRRTVHKYSVTCCNYAAFALVARNIPKIFNMAGIFRLGHNTQRQIGSFALLHASLLLSIVLQTPAALVVPSAVGSFLSFCDGAFAAVLLWQAGIKSVLHCTVMFVYCTIPRLLIHLRMRIAHRAFAAHTVGMSVGAATAAASAATSRPATSSSVSANNKYKEE